MYIYIRSRTKMPPTEGVTSQGAGVGNKRKAVCQGASEGGTVYGNRWGVYPPAITRGDVLGRDHALIPAPDCQVIPFPHTILCYTFSSYLTSDQRSRNFLIFFFFRRNIQNRIKLVYFSLYVYINIIMYKQRIRNFAYI